MAYPEISKPTQRGAIKSNSMYSMLFAFVLCLMLQHNRNYNFMSVVEAVFTTDSTSSTSDEIKAQNEIARQALASRYQRRQLFKSAVTEHYQQYMFSQQSSNGTVGTSTIADSHLENHDECVFFNNAIKQEDSDEGDDEMIMSEWTIRYCPGQSLTKFKLSPLHVTAMAEEESNSSTIQIEGQKYIMSAAHYLGDYLDKSIMTQQFFDNEIYKFWGEKPFITNSDSNLSIHSYHAYGDECKSPVSGTGMKAASTIHVRNECCGPETSMNISNYFQNQVTDDGLTIQKVLEKSTCRYSVILCEICSNNKDTKSPEMNQYEQDGHLQKMDILDLYLHLPDNDIAKKVDVAKETKVFSPMYLHQLQDTTPRSFPPMPSSRVQSNIDLLKSMFQHGYDSYMYNAYPASELKPKSCTGGTFHLIRLPALTLIDTLDTLLIMGNHTEFARSVERLRLLDMEMKTNNIWKSSTEEGGVFAVNQNVSLFETNIRVLGGLLSAHQMAEAWVENKVFLNDVFDKDNNIMIGQLEKYKIKNKDDTMTNGDGDYVPKMNTCSEQCMQSFSFDDICFIKQEDFINGTTSENDNFWTYDGFLLRLAHDIGRRLLPAFQTRTGIPYGTVNLLYGIPHQETPIASLAGAGSLSIEMELLSRLTGNEEFGKAAKLAARALWLRRNKANSLIGKHIDVETGMWTETLSGIGSNSDSFHEYLLKHYILFPEDDDFFDMFHDLYSGIHKHGRQGDWYPNIEMTGGSSTKTHVFESLAGFYPGLQVLLGELNPASRSENAFMNVREHVGFLPERFDYGKWATMPGHEHHPLRPEIHESSYFLHMATKDVSANIFDSTKNATSDWLWGADFSFREIEKKTKTGCGYAVVDSVKPLIGNLRLQDEMPSFFLSETLKYFFLAFDSNNPLNIDVGRHWVFTTEAHPIHYVPKKSQIHTLENTKQKIIKKLKYRVKERKTMRDNIPVSDLEVKKSCKKNSREEKWTLSSKRVDYWHDLCALSDEESNIDMEVFGHIVANETEFDLNFANLEHNVIGRGAQLTKSCPNFHHPNSYWVNALAGEQLTYNDMFVTTFSDEKLGLDNNLPALTSAALFGHSYYLKKRTNSCSLKDRHQQEYYEEKTKPDRVQPLSIQRVDMGHDIGTFDVSTLNGEGFYIKHVETGESIEATIIDKIVGQHSRDAFVAIESHIPVIANKHRNENKILKSLGSSFSKLKSVFQRKRDLEIPTIKQRSYERKVLISDMNGNAFSCEVELIHASGELKKAQTPADSGSNEALIYKKEKKVGSYPCLPAIYGPTELQELLYTDGVSYEAVLYGPNEKDPAGCSKAVNETKDTKNEEARIELVHRGTCNFRTKAINIGKRNNNIKAVIVTNTESKLFVMAGASDRQFVVENEPASILVTKEDGAEIMDIMERLKAKNVKKSQVKARIRIIPQNYQTPKKDVMWPRVTTSADHVQILASQGWGVSAKKDHDAQWALYILQHDASRIKND